MSLQAGAGRMPLNLPDGPTTTDGTSLAVRALVLDDGQTRLALVSLTVICLRREEADLVRAAVREPIALEGHTLHMTVSVGIATANRLNM